jgi:hypothetical protein
MPCIRGGNEFGEDWHKAGMLDKKQNVFDDFIAAAEFLIKEGYTSNELLAIEGGSNGGLLVGACMTQRPDLFKVAFPQVGVLDMLRFHKFTVGKGWIPEYGCADSSKTQFDYSLQILTLSQFEKRNEVSRHHGDDGRPRRSCSSSTQLQIRSATCRSIIKVKIQSSSALKKAQDTEQE